MCFPTFAGFSGGHVPGAPTTRTSRSLMLQAYNDWHIDEWCAAYPGRFIPLAIPPIWDPRGHGRRGPPGRRPRAARAITMPELPHIQGLPSYHDLDYWGPFFEAVSDEQVVMCLHIGQGFAAINTRARRPDRQHDHPRHAGVGARRPGPALGTGASAPTPTSRSRGPRPASAGSRSTSTAATATTRTSGGSATTSATSCRATSSASTRWPAT